MAYQFNISFGIHLSMTAFLSIYLPACPRGTCRNYPPVGENEDTVYKFCKQIWKWSQPDEGHVYKTESVI